MSSKENEKFHELVREQKAELDYQELNHTAREKLVHEISKRMQLVQIVNKRNIQFAVDYADMAMIQAEGFSLEEAQSNLDQTQEWLGYVVSNLQHDIERLGVLKKLAEEIRESEDV